MAVVRLKEFIRQIRQAKTAADERAVIARESAAIRTSFKQDSSSSATSPTAAAAASSVANAINSLTSLEARNINIAKMLYIHMLGYPAHFGQLECLKLVAGGRFPDKRLGYLGVMLLLDENQEVLTLVTNSLKNDLNSPNMYTVGLALATLGNIASQEMARDLADEVVRLMSSSNSYIKKKAILCALKICQKLPESADQFVARAKQILSSERNHAVLNCCVSLIINLCEIDAFADNGQNWHDYVMDEFRPMVGHLIRHLKALMGTGHSSSSSGAHSHSSEHDVGGVNDPFLQIKILQLMRILARNHRQTSDQITDCLTQLASHAADHPSSQRNVALAVLYETCLTILEIQDAEKSLLVLAINMLGKLLGNPDNNVRYVALNTLARAVDADRQAVQRHRATVLECLHDQDISIRRRALELSFYLINQSNVRMMVRELLLFMEVCEDSEFKWSLPGKIWQVSALYKPNQRWLIDTMIRVFKLGQEYVKDDVLSGFLKTVGNSSVAGGANNPHTSSMQAYATGKLYWSLVGSGWWAWASSSAAIINNNGTGHTKQRQLKNTKQPPTTIIKQQQQQQTSALVAELDLLGLGTDVSETIGAGAGAGENNNNNNNATENKPQTNEYQQPPPIDVSARQEDFEEQPPPEALVLACAWCMGEYGDLVFGQQSPQVDSSSALAIMPSNSQRSSSPVYSGLDMLDTGDGDASKDHSKSNVSSSQQQITINQVLDLFDQLLQVLDTQSSARSFSRRIDGANQQATMIEYLLTSLLKLCSRHPVDSTRSRVKKIFQRYFKSEQLEIQQRCLEYAGILDLLGGVGGGGGNILDRMPVPEPEQPQPLLPHSSSSSSPAVSANANSKHKGGGELEDLLMLDVDDNNVVGDKGNRHGFASPTGSHPANNRNEQDLLSSLDFSSTNGSTNQRISAPETSSALGGAVNHNKQQDLLADIFGSSSTSAAMANKKNSSDILGLYNNSVASSPSAGINSLQASSPQPLHSAQMSSLQQQQQPSSSASSAAAAAANQELDHLFGSISTTTGSAQDKASFSQVVYEQKSLRLVLHAKRAAKGQLEVRAEFSNLDAHHPITRLNLLVAVPKSIKLQLSPPQSTEIQAGHKTPVEQKMQIEHSAPNSSMKGIKLKLKLEFCPPGNFAGSPEQQQQQLHQELINFSGFPELEW